MNNLLVIVIILSFMYILTILKLYDLGLSFKLANLLGINIYRYLIVNIKAFLKYRKRDRAIAIKILLKPLNYGQFLEDIAESALMLEEKITALIEIAPTLNSKERLDLNKELKRQGLSIRIEKNNRLVFEESKKQKSEIIEVDENPKLYRIEYEKGEFNQLKAAI